MQESRKIRKPKIEKVRRARINNSLESLKEMLLRNTITIPQGSRPTKLEKADILEMTVRYIEMLHEKLYNVLEKPAGKSVEVPGRQKFDSNQIIKQKIHEDSKAWFNNNLRFRSESNKENLSNFTKNVNHLELSKHHWRPW